MDKEQCISLISDFCFHNGLPMPENYGDYYLVNSILSIWNEKNNTGKRIDDFRSLESVKALVMFIESSINQKVIITKRGRYNGGSWFHWRIFIEFCRWIDKLPNLYYERKELAFVECIRAAFNGVLEFEEQIWFDGYRVDLFCRKLNIVIEFDETHHKYYTIKDQLRQKHLEERYGVEFIRHSENDNIFHTINKVISLLTDTSHETFP